MMRMREGKTRTIVSKNLDEVDTSSTSDAAAIDR